LENGQIRQEISLGSFIPLFWRGLDKEKQTALLEKFETAPGVPGQQSSSWEQEDTDDTTQRPAIHEFIAFEAIRANENHILLMLFVQRAREKSAVWFEHESLTAAREKPSGGPAYSMGPVTAALILTVQAEFEREAAQIHSIAQLILRWADRLKIRPTDLYIITGFLLLSAVAHLLYALPHSWNAEARVSEAALDYQQGRYTEAMRICRRYPHHAVSQFVQANMMMLSKRPDQAEDLYRQALTQEPASPSALLGLALALQMNGSLKEAEKRYADFLDIYENRLPAAAELADEFRMLSQEEFRRPPRWQRIFELPLMNDLGL
jgi:tetratricopeptide (TPR) repeat protein